MEALLSYGADEPHSGSGKSHRPPGTIQLAKAKAFIKPGNATVGRIDLQNDRFVAACFCFLDNRLQQRAASAFGTSIFVHKKFFKGGNKTALLGRKKCRGIGDADDAIRHARNQKKSETGLGNDAFQYGKQILNAYFDMVFGKLNAEEFRAPRTVTTFGASNRESLHRERAYSVRNQILRKRTGQSWPARMSGPELTLRRWRGITLWPVSP